MIFSSALKTKLVYVYSIPDKAHAGCLKVGEATVDSTDLWKLAPNSSELNKVAKERINHQTSTAGVYYQLLYTELLVYIKDKQIKSVNDGEVHKVLTRSGIKKKYFDTEARANEWFITDLETIKNAITAAKQERAALQGCEITKDRTPIVFRPEQDEAIKKTKKRFNSGGKRMLWYAKMRFGKTLSALQVVKDMEFQRTIIVTHRPVVDEGWFKDFDKIFYDSPVFHYGSKNNGETFSNLEAKAKKGTGKYIYFASMQDLRGSEEVGGKFNKNDEVFSNDWDLVIVDEAHEGTQTELGESVLKALVKEETRVLHLSGTPFNLLDDFDDSETYTWDYVMEQRAKANWDLIHCGDVNPYASLPRMNIYTYDLGKLYGDFKDDGGAFNFREFFRTEDGSFKHEKDVKSFLDLLSKDDESNYPYSKKEYQDNFRHSLWMVPGVKEAKALSTMLQNHPVFGNFEIVNVAGDGDEEKNYSDALKAVQDAIAQNEYTITISCGRLTTGVSVPNWTAVFMLSGSYSTSAAGYMQTIFRVQTPATINGKVKEECFVFDFAPDRTLKVIAETAKFSIKGGKSNSESDRQKMGEFLNFCPIISMDGSQMKPYNVPHLLEQLKRVYIERVVSRGFEDIYLYDNDALMQLDELALKDFEKLKGKIGSTKANHNTGEIDINNQGFTAEEREEIEKAEKKKKSKQPLTEEEKRLLEEKKEKNKNRLSAISILRGISIRMPLLIYGADILNENEINLDNFTSLVDDLSWSEFMPYGVTKDDFNVFKKYYDKEVFSASGRRIREMVRAADGKPIEERIERIASIFGSFKNPDKETVLTPWRVVNLHLSSSIGGWDFYDTNHINHSSEPRFVDRGKVTADIFNPDTRILEINSKSGLYPLYMTYSVYRAKLQTISRVGRIITDESRLSLWDDVVANNIYVVCKTPMAKSITKRTLLGFREGKANTRYFTDLINQMQNKQDSFLKKVCNANEYSKKNQITNMRFNVVVGNPPYQITVAKKDTDNGQKRVSSIFHFFKINSEKIANYTSLIYPAGRWIHQSAKGLAQFGLSQINDVHLKQLEYYPNSKEIFESAAIADGISIVLKDMSKTESGFRYVYTENGVSYAINAKNPGDKLMPLNPFDEIIVHNIINKIRNSNGEMVFLHPSILSQKLFSIESDFVEKNPDKVREYNEGGTFDEKTEIKLFTNDKGGKSGRARWYITKKSVITTGIEYLDKWKVVVSSANAGGQKRSNQITILDNHSAFGRARVALKTFNTKTEAQNFFKYANSTFIRFTFLLTDESLTSLARLVPDIKDYSDNNHIIDFSKDVDEQLFRLFDIDAHNQAHIREVVAKKSKD